MSVDLAEQLIDVLRQAGVQRVYGVVGDSLNPVVDAIRRADGIDWVHVRNEEAGAFAAAAEAQLTGRLAVCAGSCTGAWRTRCGVGRMLEMARANARTIPGALSTGRR